MNKSITVVVLVFLFAAGCATMGDERIRDTATIDQIEIGVTTKDDVRDMVGYPTKVTFEECGDETWEYVLTKAQTRAASFIPIIGLFAGGMDTQMYTLTVRYDENGVVKKYGRGQTTGGAGSLSD